MALARPALGADLHYRPDDPDQRVAGTIANNLSLALEEVYLFYGKSAYPLPGLKTGGPVPVALDPGRAVEADRCRSAARPRPADDEEAAGARPYDPSPLVKELLFHEYVGGNNHSFRLLDQSWRLRELQSRDEGVREAVLVARLPRAKGPANELAAVGDL